ncbi:MAG: hypothetical protein GKR98_04020 [Boseongicola sp.]|nr:MAG: hypothetical protein GKR98_04020 [Boseongicola sp.]
MAASFFLTTAAHAVGTEQGSDEPPKPTETTQDCAHGTIWDDKIEACVAPEDSTNDQASLYLNARELAWAGRLDDASRVLNVMQPSHKVLTYQGFVVRAEANWSKAESLYQAALTANPNNLLARSYYGQGLAENGDISGAQNQLSEIRQRGGRISWPETALRLTIETNSTAY